MPFRLTDLANYYNGVAFKPSDWSEDGLPIIRIEQLNNPNGVFDKYQGPVAEINYVRNGDLIFSWSATLKVVIWRNGDAVLNQHLFKVIPKPGYDLRFIYFLLDFHMEALGSGSHGSTMKHIKRSELDKFIVRVPNLARQNKIAAILTSIDTAIEKTEALIEKYRQIKAGLMHDLFTRGVLPNGQLRPPRTQAPELYQETEIGWIPRDWDLNILDDLIRIIDCKHITPKYIAEGYPVIRPRNVKVDGLDFEDVEYVSLGDYRALTDIHEPKPGDIVFSRNASFGVPAYVDENIGNFAIGQDVVVMTKSKADTLFIFYYLLSNNVCKQITIKSGGSTFARINLGDIRHLKICTPSIEEQLLFAQRLKTLDKNLSQRKSELDKFRKQKLGLMRDLLTGKVPVKVDDSIAEAASG